MSEMKTVIALADRRVIKTAMARAQVVNMVNSALHKQVLMTIKHGTDVIAVNPFAVVTIEDFPREAPGGYPRERPRLSLRAESDCLRLVVEAARWACEAEFTGDRLQAMSRLRDRLAALDGAQR